MEIGLALLLVLAAFGIGCYGFVWGFVRRGRVTRLLEAEEPRLAHLVRTNTSAATGPGATTLVMGNVAYGADAPARLATTWRTVFGGRADSMTNQADLARRLAVVRMLQDAERRGATAVTNVRIETSEIVSSQRAQGMTVIELLACGTAVVPQP